MHHPTVVESLDVNVAAADNSKLTTAVSFLVNAGNRFEPKPVVAYPLKHYVFKCSFLGTVREAEIYGGVLSSSRLREHLVLMVQFLRGDE
ncbi:hypothetical protein L227DRAFT_514911 [Lentinus tigrinus ALCF2SS1-6]|uniref:Uncharacterized protein n=1 Tax=Lentinus tigrinus ALCF2SS1-6 TaxID=1328759 RepID=A0A5C2RN99_9APHY|nr:hypothetical protein L227DRAFT_514911 [Lentinus tigrinus ALCF2SS1-6]